MNFDVMVLDVLMETKKGGFIYACKAGNSMLKVYSSQILNPGETVTVSFQPAGNQLFFHRVNKKGGAK